MSDQTKRGTPEGSARKKRFVFVVDNNQQDASYASVLLQNLGYTSTMARSGEEAMELLAVATVSLVITELVLPGMNGIDLYERITRNPSMPAVPVIIVTKLAVLALKVR
ncbi:MAG: response regulator, partial [Nitrospirae bacterium]|nr:response regulator [Nitrospirota bacterium]